MLYHPNHSFLTQSLNTGLGQRHPNILRGLPCVPNPSLNSSLNTSLSSFNEPVWGQRDMGDTLIMLLITSQGEDE